MDFRSKSSRFVARSEVALLTSPPHYAGGGGQPDRSRIRQEPSHHALHDPGAAATLRCRARGRFPLAGPVHNHRSAGMGIGQRVQRQSRSGASAPRHGKAVSARGLDVALGRVKRKTKKSLPKTLEGFFVDRSARYRNQSPVVKCIPKAKAMRLPIEATGKKK